MAAPALDSGWGRRWGVVLPSLRDTVSSGTRVRGLPGLRADTRECLQGWFLPWLPVEPYKGPDASPGGTAGIMGITPSHGTPGPPDSRRPTPPGARGGPGR